MTALNAITPQTAQLSPTPSPGLGPQRVGRGTRAQRRREIELAAQRMLQVCVRVPQCEAETRLVLALVEGETPEQVVLRLCAMLREEGVALRDDVDPPPYTLRLANSLGRFVRGCPPFNAGLPLAEQLVPPFNVVFIEDPAFLRGLRRMQAEEEERRTQEAMVAVLQTRGANVDARSARRDELCKDDLRRCVEYERTRVEREAAVRAEAKQTAAAKLEAKLHKLEAAAEHERCVAAAEAAATRAQQMKEVNEVLDILDAAAKTRAGIESDETAQWDALLAARVRSEQALRSAERQRTHMVGVKASLAKALDESAATHERKTQTQAWREAERERKLQAFRNTIVAQVEKTERYFELQRTLAFVEQHEQHEEQPGVTAMM